MKKCSYCGKEYPDDAEVCLIDEQPLSDGETMTPVAEEVAVPSLSAPQAPVLPGLVLTDRQMETLEVVLVCVIAFGASILSSAYIFWGGAYDQKSGGFIWVTYSLREGTCLALLWYLLRRRGSSFYALGLTWSWRDFGWSVVLAIAANIGFYMTYYGMYDLMRLTGTAAFANDELGQNVEKFLFGGGIFISTVLFAVINPFFEELIARAYLMTQVKRLTNSVTAAILISTVLQTSYHFYQGGLLAISDAAVFFIFSIFYARTNRIMPIILAHLYLDVGGILQYWLRS